MKVNMVKIPFAARTFLSPNQRRTQTVSISAFFLSSLSQTHHFFSKYIHPYLSITIATMQITPIMLRRLLCLAHKTDYVCMYAIRHSHIQTYIPRNVSLKLCRYEKRAYYIRNTKKIKKREKKMC